MSEQPKVNAGGTDVEWRVAVMNGEHTAVYAQGTNRQAIANAFAMALVEHPGGTYERVVLQKRQVAAWEDTDA